MSAIGTGSVGFAGFGNAWSERPDIVRLSVKVTGAYEFDAKGFPHHTKVYWMTKTKHPIVVEVLHFRTAKR
ncbi:hypothetical protein SCOR_33285 [Sulfidibacter corallicola]